MKTHTMTYKYCLVPGCYSTTVRTPEKYFFCMPSDRKRRVQWIHAIRRSPKDIASKTHSAFVCEDHFNLKEDLLSYVKFQLKGGKQQRLKPHVVPTLFDCQPDRTTAHSAKKRSLVEKLQRTQTLQSILQAESPADESVGSADEIKLNTYKEQSDISEGIPDSVLELEAAHSLCMLSRGSRHEKSTQCCLRNTTCEAAVQCNLKEPQRDVTTNSSTTPTATSPSSISNNSGSWLVSSESNEVMKVSNLNKTLFLCRTNPRRYIGINKSCLGLTQLLSSELKCNEKYIFIILQKIRKDISFGELGDYYDLSPSQISRIFSHYLVPIANILKEFIFWPPVGNIKRTLPLAFRENYSKVQSIIDCFEIQIEQPTDPVKQTLTWSEYKKCNTMKYLVSSTPNGFISEGYGGRISDMKLLKKSGYLDFLPQGCWVMADRGFKGITPLLEEKHCKLVRPPSAVAGEKLTRLQVLQTRQIASLRIHIERVIRRMRKFNIIKPHSCVNIKLIKYLDYIVNICAALVNTQDSLIKSY